MPITEKEWFIEAPWGRLCIVAWGHCLNPPVLLCHGHNDSIMSFRPLIRLLPENYYYIGVELPGHGKSEPFPPGLLMNFYDLASCLDVVVKHFRWKHFMFIGHSAGAGVGMLYNFCVPGKITKLIALDPFIPTVEPDTFADWYKRSYQKLFDDYDYYNAQKERRPVYTRQEALKKLLNMEGMTKELAEVSLERVSENAGNGLVRFTFDQRYNIIASALFTPDQLKNLFLNSESQILLVIPDQSLKMFSKVPFLFDESVFKNNYRVRQVRGHHNTHISNPESVEVFVSQFLNHGAEGLDAKAKL